MHHVLVVLFGLVLCTSRTAGEYPACTPAFIEELSQSLFDKRNGGTNCPSAEWKEQFFSSALTQARTDPITIFDIGCNKALDALSTVNLYNQNFTVTRDEWYQRGGWKKCGACHQCRGGGHPTPGTLPKTVRLHCIEPLPSNFVRIDQNADYFGLKERGMRVVSGAFTSLEDAEARNWTADFPNPGNDRMFNNFGHEGIGIGVGTRRYCKDHHCPLVPIPLFVLDQYMAAEKLSDVDILSIDTEGNDALVLQGAERTLRDVKYLEFEFHEVGMWKKLELRDVLLQVEKAGFVCYWIGLFRVWRITDCWHPKFGSHRWSNIGCVKPAVKEWYDIMEWHFNKTMPH